MARRRRATAAMVLSALGWAAVAAHAAGARPEAVRALETDAVSVAVLALVSGVVSGSIVAWVSSFYAPRRLGRARAWTDLRAGLEGLQVYVTSAQQMPEHGQFQVEWSQASLGRFEHVLASATEVGRAPDLREVGRWLAGWAARAPFISGDEEKIAQLRNHLLALDGALGKAVHTLFGRPRGE